jgi:hypothetical protein
VLNSASKALFLLPADHKVSVAWQIVFTFFTGFNFWAFYRVKRLQKYVILIVIPLLAVVIALASYYFYATVAELLNDSPGETLAENATVTYEPQINVVQVGPATGQLRVAFDVFRTGTIVAGIGFQALAVYLVIKWSREHNSKFASPAQTGK